MADMIEALNFEWARTTNKRYGNPMYSFIRFPDADEQPVRVLPPNLVGKREFDACQEQTDTAHRLPIFRKVATA